MKGWIHRFPYGYPQQVQVNKHTLLRGHSHQCQLDIQARVWFENTSNPVKILNTPEITIHAGRNVHGSMYSGGTWENTEERQTCERISLVRRILQNVVCISIRSLERIAMPYVCHVQEEIRNKWPPFDSGEAAGYCRTPPLALVYAKGREGH